MTGTKLCFSFRITHVSFSSFSENIRITEDDAKVKTTLPQSKYLNYLSHITRKPVFRVSEQARHKPGCATTEDG